MSCLRNLDDSLKKSGKLKETLKARNEKVVSPSWSGNSLAISIPEFASAFWTPAYLSKRLKFWNQVPMSCPRTAALHTELMSDDFYSVFISLLIKKNVRASTSRIPTRD